MFTSGPSPPPPPAQLSTSGGGCERAWLALLLLGFDIPGSASFLAAHSLQPARGRVAAGQTYASFHSTNPPLAWRNNCSSGHGLLGSFVPRWLPSAWHTPFQSHSFSNTVCFYQILASANEQRTLERKAKRGGGGRGKDIPLPPHMGS